MLGRFQQPLSLLLLIACVYQLGASPCGCWEHSGWRQAALHLTGSSDSCGSDHDANVAKSAECDHAAFPAARVTPRSGLPHIDSIALWSGVPSDLVAAASNGPLAVTGARPGIDDLALPMRAELQVFRL